MQISSATSGGSPPDATTMQPQTQSTGDNGFEAALASNSLKTISSSTGNGLVGAPLGFEKLVVGNIYNQAMQFGNQNGIGPGALVSKMESAVKNSSGDPTSQDPNDNTNLDQN